MFSTPKVWGLGLRLMFRSLRYSGWASGKIGQKWWGLWVDDHLKILGFWGKTTIPTEIWVKEQAK